MSAQTGFTVAQASYTRVFIIEGRARPDHSPSYESCLRMLGVSRGFGDIERVECPDPLNYGKFIEVAQIRGATERATTSLEGRYATSALSTLLKLANAGCAFDVQLHMGTCTDPTDFDTFEKAIVFESAALTNYGTDDLGALGSGDNAVINENADLSASDLYEIRPLTFTEQAASIITNEILDVAIIDSESCGDCDEESSGCDKVFGISTAAGGSPSTPADVVFYAGGAWYAHDIDSMGAADVPDGVDGVGAYVVVVSNDTASLHYALKSEFDGITDPDWTEVTTGFVAGGEPNDIWSPGGSFAFIVGDGGYVYMTTDPTAGVTVLDAGSATVDDLYRVHGLSEDFAVAVGANGAIVWTSNGVSWGATTGHPVGVGVSLNAVWVKSKNEWWVGSSAGNLYYTLDQGVTWTLKTFSGSGSGVVYDIVFSTASVGYLAHTTATPRGRILRTYNGGQSWKVMPENVGTLPLNDRVNRLAYCSDANVVAGGGLGDNGTDGYMVLGQTT